MELKKMIGRIIDRVNINLREPHFDVGPYIRNIVAFNKFSLFYAFYGLTFHYPLHFRFHKSSISGSYFLGKCIVDHSILYKSDIRGDELKAQGDVFMYGDKAIPLHDDEVIRIRDSYLIKSLVHSNSHDPESLEEFFIYNTIAMHYANIHGSPTEGSFIAPFATVDLTTVHDCVIGVYSYVQVGELSHQLIQDGRVFIHAEGIFRFDYRFEPNKLRPYIHMEPGTQPEGTLFDFVESRNRDFEEVFERIQHKSLVRVPHGAYLSRYSVIKGDTRLSENVLVAQRAYLEDAWVGKGSNAQENCYIISSLLEGYNITAHGGKVIHARLGKKVFVGFNSFLRGAPDCQLNIGGDCIVMPHTIIDLEEPLDIPPACLVWGFIRNRKDLESNSLLLDDLTRVRGEVKLGAMSFEGDGAAFVNAFKERIEHILESNGAYYDGGAKRAGHAQKGGNIIVNIIQPYPEGALKGIYPTIDIQP